MANILDYLDWRGDIPFSVDPFNEVDNLILAQTAYTRLDGMLGNFEHITPTEALHRFFGKYTPAEITANKPLHKDAPFILEKLANSRRFEGMVMSHYVNEIDIKQEAQMSAMTFIHPDFTYIAFRGTDETLVGWKEDFNLSYMSVTEGQKKALRYLNDAMADAGDVVYVGGHSKGGNFSVYASAFCDEKYRDRIKRVYSNDGPGFRKEMLETSEYNDVLKKVTSILPESTLVGMLFSGKYDHKFIKSSLKGLQQHDATSWQVLGNHFVETDDQSEEGRKMDEAVCAWIDELSDEERKLFSDVTFDILTSSGATSMQDLSAPEVLKLLRKTRGVQKDKRSQFNAMLRRLFKLGGDAIMKG